MKKLLLIAGALLFLAGFANAQVPPPRPPHHPVAHHPVHHGPVHHHRPVHHHHRPVHRHPVHH